MMVLLQFKVPHMVSLMSDKFSFRVRFLLLWSHCIFFHWKQSIWKSWFPLRIMVVAISQLNHGRQNHGRRHASTFRGQLITFNDLQNQNNNNLLKEWKFERIQFALLGIIWLFAGLAHCYKMLIDLGPVSHDKAVTACGYLGGSMVVTFDNAGDHVSTNLFFVDIRA